MANWTIQFKNLQEDDVVVTIGGATTDTALTPGANPLTVGFDCDNEVFRPIAEQTGNLQIVCTEEEYESLIPSRPIDRPVTVTVDGNIAWVGFLQASGYEQDWDTVNREVSVPVCSPLSVLSGLFISTEPTDNSFYDSVATWLVNMNTAMGNPWQNFYIPQELSPYALLDAKVSRRNFLSVIAVEDRDDISTDMYEPKTYSDMMENLCKLTGWSARDGGNSLFLVRGDASWAYYKITLEQMEQIARDGISKTTIGQIAAVRTPVEELQFVSTENKVSYEPGKRSVTVTGNTHEWDGSVFNYGELHLYLPYVCGESASRSHSSVMYNAGVYVLGDRTGVACTNNIPSTSEKKSLTVLNADGLTYSGAQAVREMVGKLGEMDDYTDRIVLAKDSTATDHSEDRCVKFTASEYVDSTPSTEDDDGNFVSIQCISVEANIKVKDDSLYPWEVESYDSGIVYMSIECGGMYCKGSGVIGDDDWTTTKQIFSCKHEDGKLELKVRMPYGICAKPVVTFYAPISSDYRGYNDSTLKSGAHNYICIEDIDIKICPLEDLTFISATDHTTKRSTMGNGFQEEWSSECDLTIKNGRQAGMGILLDADDCYVEQLFTGGGLPETRLRDRASTWFSKSRRVLDVKIRETEMMGQNECILWNKVYYIPTAQSMNFRDCELEVKMIMSDGEDKRLTALKITSSDLSAYGIYDFKVPSAGSYQMGIETTPSDTSTSKSVTWSVVKDPTGLCSISSAGVLTVAAHAGTTGATIRVTSTVYPDIYADAELLIM